MDEQQRKALALALGLPESATAEEIKSAAQENVAAAAALRQVGDAIGATGSTAEILGAVTGLAQTSTSLAARMEALEATSREQQASQLFAQAKAEGKVTAQNEQWARELAVASPDQFRGWMQHAPRVVPVAGTAQPLHAASAGLSPAVDVDAAMHRFAPVARSISRELLMQARLAPGEIDAPPVSLSDEDRTALAEMSESEIDAAVRWRVLPRNWVRYNSDEFVKDHTIRGIPRALREGRGGQ